MKEFFKKLLDPLYRWLTWYMGATGLILYGGKGSAPAAPDYAGAARQQGESSKEVTNMQNWANRPTQITPFGRVDWTPEARTDPATGQPVTAWTQKTQLDPQSQAALESQLAATRGRSDLAQGFMGRVAQDYQQPFDWQNLPGAQGTSPTTRTTGAPEFAAERERYTNAAMEQMRPEHQFQEQQTRTMLANQGLTPGSEAYNRELDRLGKVQAGERWNAINQGGIEQQRMLQGMLAQQGQAFGQQQGSANLQNQLRQQAIAEQAQRRGMSLNEMNALLSGQQVNAPQMPQFMGASAAQPVQYLPAAQAQGAYQMQQYQADQAANSAMWGGLGSLAGMGAMYYGGR